MTTSDRPPDEFNPYAAPAVPIGLPAIDPTGNTAEAEAVRRRYLDREASIRSIGSLHVLAAILCAVGLVFVVGMNFGSDFGVPVGGLLALVAVLSYNALLGWGLTRLQPWARWADAAVVGFVLLGLITGIGAALSYAGLNQPQDVLPVLLIWGTIGLIPAYLLFLFVGTKAAVVFSAEYQDVIARTPHIKYRTSFLAWLVFGLVILVAVGFIFGV